MSPVLFFYLYFITLSKKASLKPKKKTVCGENLRSEQNFDDTENNQLCKILLENKKCYATLRIDAGKCYTPDRIRLNMMLHCKNEEVLKLLFTIEKI